MERVTHRPFLFIAVFYCIGITVVRCWHCSLWVWPFGLLLALLTVLTILRQKSWASAILLAGVGVCAGAVAWCSYTAVPREHISRFIGACHTPEVQLKVRVVLGSDSRESNGTPHTRFLGDAEELSCAGVAYRTNGRVLVNVYRAVEAEPGDEVSVSGRLLVPSSFGGRGRLSFVDTLAGRKVLASINVRKAGEFRVLRPGREWWMPVGAGFCRGWLNGVFERYLSPGEAGLMKGFITGDRTAIEEHVTLIFMRTGTTHLLAVSGLNVAMVAVGIFFILSLLPVPRRVRMVMAIVITGWYAYVAGGSSPVVRSAVMSAVFILSFALEREQESLNTLAIASMAILVVNPTQLFDVGFQLSFVGVLSLILVSPQIAGIFPSGKPGGFCREYLGATMAAFLGTTGIVAYYFGTITPVSLLSNIPAVPLVGLITAIGELLLIVSGIPFLAVPVSLVLKAALNLLVYLLYLCTFIPGGFFYLETLPALWQVAAYYACLLILIIFMRRGR
ncbi:MAG: ComEC/Rec2 family competence protein [Candidatus Omnitrophica bacterium]|nr:ComEC/Rec2 family competence protein [Candidatus Omnitrophota bacterium]